MAIKQFNARINMKRDTASNWEQNNPVLLNGEIIIVDTASGEVRFKIGDGTKLYKQLPFSDEAVRALISAKQDEISLTENKAVISDASGKLSVSEVTSTELSYLDGVSSNLQTQIDNKVPTTRKINSKPLSSDITLNASDVNAVPTSRKINGKTLSSDITLNASDVSALPSSTAIITYDSLLPVEATTPINADTLNGHGSDYFATSTDVNNLQSNVNSLQNNINTLSSDKLSKSGGTMVGKLVAQNNSNYTVAQVRNIFISTTEPSGGGNGDIWLQYSE